jgi:predicted nucleotidyltransferase
LSTPSKTLTRDEAIRRLQDGEPEIRSLGVERLALFGSVLRGEAGPESDVDLLVGFAPGAKSFDRLLALSQGYLSGRAWGRGAVEHPLKADVLVDIRPMDALPAANETEVLALIRGSIGEPPRPGEGDSDGSPVAEASEDLIVGDFDGSDDGVGFSRSVGARHLGSPSGAVGSASGCD